MTEPEGPGDPQPQGEREDKPELDVDSVFAAIVAGFSDPVPHGVGPWPAAEDLDDPDEASDPGQHGPVPGATGPATGAAGGPAGRPGTGPAPAASAAAGPAASPAPPGAAPAGPAPVAPSPAGPGTRPPSSWEPPARRIVLPGDDLVSAGGPGSGRPAGAGAAGDDGHEEEGYVPPEPPPFPRGDLVSRLAWGAVIGGPLFLLLAALVWRSLPTGLLLFALTAFVGGFVTLVARMPQEHPDDPDDGAVV